MKHYPTAAVLFACIAIISAAGYGAEIYVAPTGKTGAAGTAAAPLAGLDEAVGRAHAGDVIRVAGGTYKYDKVVRLSASGTATAPIRVEPADAARPLFDFSAEKFSDRNSGILVSGDYWQVVGLEVIGTARFGIETTGHHNVIERCVAHDNQNTGIQLSAPASYNLVLNCDSYRNVDRPTRGENADGFGAKYQIGAGNIFRSCRAWENADDGFDLWKAPFPVHIEYCVAFRNGVDLWGIEGYVGNGNGIKIGGDFIPAAHVVIGCVAMDQPNRGFDQNNNTGGLTVEQCTAIRCKFGFSFTTATVTGQPHALRDNVSWDAPAEVVTGTVLERNRWMTADGVPWDPTIGESLPTTKDSWQKPRPVPPAKKS